MFWWEEAKGTDKWPVTTDTLATRITTRKGPPGKGLSHPNMTMLAGCGDWSRLRKYNSRLLYFRNQAEGQGNRGKCENEILSQAIAGLARVFVQRRIKPGGRHH